MPGMKSKCCSWVLESREKYARAILVSSLSAYLSPLTLTQSTVLKQMKLIHHGGYNEQERDSYKEIIVRWLVLVVPFLSMFASLTRRAVQQFSNTIQSMRAILEALPGLGINIDPANDARRALVMSLPGQIEGDVLHPDISDAVRGLWNDPRIREAVRRAREFQLNDSAV